MKTYITTIFLSVIAMLSIVGCDSKAPPSINPELFPVVGVVQEQVAPAVTNDQSPDKVDMVGQKATVLMHENFALKQLKANIPGTFNACFDETFSQAPTFKKDNNGFIISAIGTAADDWAEGYARVYKDGSWLVMYLCVEQEGTDPALVIIGSSNRVGPDANAKEWLMTMAPDKSPYIITPEGRDVRTMPGL